MKGFSVLEVILAVALFMIFTVGAITVVVQSYNSNRLGAENTIANQFAVEGIEAVKSIKNQAYANLVNTTSCGLVRNASNVWAFQSPCTNNTLIHNSTDDYIRTIKVEDVYRDASPPNGNVVSSAGTLDPSTKKITSTVTWNFNSAIAEITTLVTYLSDWRKPLAKNGMLIFGDGGTTSNTVKYKTFDSSSNTWSSATAAFSAGSSNQALRAIELYASSTRNEKIAVSRHFDGTAQFIYATVFNGTSWGSPQSLSSWAATTFTDVQNFDGVYLNDGTFMVVYSDNSIIPKYKTWNGTSWSAQGSLTSLGSSQIPTFIITRARSGTNEVMAAFSTQGSDVITEYWNGSVWSAITSHYTSLPVNTKKGADFGWSPNSSTIGMLIYPGGTGANANKRLTSKIFTANGTGGGSWGSAVTSSTSQSNTIGSLDLASRPAANEYQGCNKDNGATPTVVCNLITFSGSTPTVNAPTIIAAATDTGIQRSFDLSYESASGAIAPLVYSDNSSSPRYKSWNGSSWSGVNTISTTGYSPGIFKTVRVIPQDSADDMISLLADANLDIYSVFWDGANNLMYTSPAAKAFLQHGVNGSATTDFWFDFAWDKY